jgi:hypothetical protein
LKGLIIAVTNFMKTSHLFFFSRLSAVVARVWRMRLRL